MQCLEHFSQCILPFIPTLLPNFHHATLNTTKTCKKALTACKTEPINIFKDAVLKTLLSQTPIMLMTSKKQP